MLYSYGVCKSFKHIMKDGNLLRQRFDPGPVRTILALIAVALAAAACATKTPVSPGNPLTLILTGPDTIEYEGRQMTPSQVVRRLRAQRVPPTTTIRVQSDQYLSDAAMTRLTDGLQRAGYGRVVFVGERHIEVETP